MHCVYLFIFAAVIIVTIAFAFYSFDHKAATAGITDPLIL